MAAAALASCEKQNSFVEQKAQEESYVYTISAVAPDMVDESAPAQAPTRTDYAADGTFSWSAGDAISVLFHNGDVNKFFTLTTTESGATAKFSGSIEAGYEIGASDGTGSDKKIWALFPASENHTYTAGSNPTFYVQPSVDFTATHFSANIPMYDLVASEGTALSFKNMACTFKFTVTGIKAGVDKVSFTIYNQTTYGLSGTWDLALNGENYYVNYGWAESGSAKSTLTYVSDVTSNQAVFYVSCHPIYYNLKPVITVSNYATGVPIKTFTATKSGELNSLTQVKPITLDVSEANGGVYYTPAITIDGDLSDWDGIATYASAATSRIIDWKFKSDSYYVFFYFKLNKSRVDSGRYLYLCFDTDNDDSTGSKRGGCAGIEKFVYCYPYTNASGASTLEYVEGFDANSYINGSKTGTVYSWGYVDSSYAYVELRVPRASLGIPDAGETISVNCSYNDYVAGAQSITLE